MNRLNTRKLHMESLEDRCLLAVVAGGIEQAAALPEPAGATGWIVNTTDDATTWDTADDILSLREAIARAQTGDTITFDDTLAGGTITLCGSQLEVYQGITIDASSIDGITIDAAGQSRVFYVSGGSADNPVEQISLTITGGNGNNDYGGGIYNNGSLTLTDCTIVGNTAYYCGGGIYSQGPLLAVANSTITENTSTTRSGGGIYSYYTLLITNSTITGNTANAEDGGGVCNIQGTLTITNSTISRNTANNCGGIYKYLGTLTLTNSIISENTADYGGGIYNNGGTLTATNSTISGNTANNGGGIYSKYGTLTLTNTIVSLNYAIEYTDLYGSYSGSNNLISIDPGFVTTPIFEDGILINADELDLSLTAESIAIDRGLNDAVETETDIAGNPRVIASCRETPTVDIGAYEYQGTVDRSTIVTTTLDIIDETDGLISLREAISYAVPGETITFDESLEGGTIILNGSQLEIYQGITIDASSIGGITIDAYDQSRVLYIACEYETDLVELISLTITGGWIEGDGGGIYVDGGLLTVKDSTITKNAAFNGGGIYSDHGTLTIMDSTIAENDVNNFGGGICNYGTLTVSDSTVTGNIATDNGGGIYNGGTATLTGSVIAGNTGYGIDNSGTLTLTNSTVAGNYGGIYVSGGTPTFTNSIISLNDANGRANIYHYYPVSGSNNIVGLDPGFVVAPIFEDGVLVNADELDLSLAAGSVAIDTGTNAAVETETDIAGNQRIAAAWREIATVDIGAYEYQGTVARGDIETPSTVVTTVLDIVDETDGLISLREAILCAAAGETITFAPSLASRTIVLDGAELVIDKNLSIDASAVGGITIDGDYRSRIFYINGAAGKVTFNLTSLAIRGGGTSYGGGIHNYAGNTLTLTNCAVTANHFYGVTNESGTVTLTNTTISGNSSGDLSTSSGTANFYNSIVLNISASSSRLYAYNTLSYFTNWTRSQNCPVYDRYLPLFADPSHGDYTLAENSQAINAGNNSYVSAETDLAGNPRILNGTVDLGAYEYTGVIEPLDAPSILTGSRGVYVSYGANRHQVTWTAVDRAVAYEFAYSLDGGSTWTSLETNDTAAVVRGLSYGTDVFYRVRALSSRYLENSDWSAAKSFRVCPMDINNDGDIGGLDRNILGIAWGKEEGDEEYRYYADINGDGDVTGFDRNLLSFNWGCETDDPDLLYPRPLAADAAFAAYASGDLDVDFGVF